MNVIVMLSNDNGMMFNERRQSQDSTLRQDVLNDSSGTTLWMNSYSKKQFTEEANNIIVDEKFLQKAQNGEYCFVENQELAPIADSIENLIVYRWNRDYPSDMTFDLDISSWVLISTIDFTGTSHEKITKEVWKHA